MDVSIISEEVVSNLACPGRVFLLLNGCQYFGRHHHYRFLAVKEIEVTSQQTKHKRLTGTSGKLKKGGAEGIHAAKHKVHENELLGPGNDWNWQLRRNDSNINSKLEKVFILRSCSSVKSEERMVELEEN